ncbi:hypothetical protein ACFV19_27560 [Streptomyces griseoluteus]|uniref:hypothetical protein n=1 Tax=Streptomyces griseoluteus TaxID=29306 RepID=UPI0036764B2C
MPDVGGEADVPGLRGVSCELLERGDALLDPARVDRQPAVEDRQPNPVIVSRPKGTQGFDVLPRRWKVERTIGWCMNARRNARDYERLPHYS